MVELEKARSHQVSNPHQNDPPPQRRIPQDPSRSHSTTTAVPICTFASSLPHRGFSLGYHPILRTSVLARRPALARLVASPHRHRSSIIARHLLFSIPFIIRPGFAAFSPSFHPQLDRLSLVASLRCPLVASLRCPLSPLSSFRLSLVLSRSPSIL
jgi:hypothetical protein